MFYKKQKTIQFFYKTTHWYVMVLSLSIIVKYDIPIYINIPIVLALLLTYWYYVLLLGGLLFCYRIVTSAAVWCQKTHKKKRKKSNLGNLVGKFCWHHDKEWRYWSWVPQHRTDKERKDGLEAFQIMVFLFFPPSFPSPSDNNSFSLLILGINAA